MGQGHLFLKAMLPQLVNPKLLLYLKPGLIFFSEMIMIGTAQLVSLSNYRVWAFTYWDFGISLQKKMNSVLGQF